MRNLIRIKWSLSNSVVNKELKEWRESPTQHVVVWSKWLDWSSQEYNLITCHELCNLHRAIRYLWTLCFWGILRLSGAVRVGSCGLVPLLPSVSSSSDALKKTRLVGVGGIITQVSSCSLLYHTTWETLQSLRIAISSKKLRVSMCENTVVLLELVLIVELGGNYEH